ncbi:ATP-binding protein [Streptomyces flavidovirens]|uniref:ATP-binding protein n=1 Tax=Streptomyces flavidovirens TaxID=67298 RepID=A0ABW6RNI4_9ACTN
MRIPVEVRPDFIEKVARRTDPLGAVEELVWNSLDADATEVRVDLEYDDLGGVSAVVVTDNGHGIPASSVETAFKGMGGVMEAGCRRHGKRKAASWPARVRPFSGPGPRVQCQLDLRVRRTGRPFQGRHPLSGRRQRLRRR